MRRAAVTLAGRLARAGEASSSTSQLSLLLRPLALGASDAIASAAAAATGSASGSRRALGTASAPSFAAASDDLSNYAVFYPEPEAEVGEAAPTFTLPAIVNGEVKDVSLEAYRGKYVLLFFYPKDFTFVCPTEIIAFSDRAKEFEALNCQVLACSTDTPEVHLAWIKTPRKRGGLGYMQIPILADVTKAVSARFGTLKRDAGIALRGLYLINPEGVLEHITVNNFPIGRNVDEALRTLQAIQYVAEHGEVCPAGWQPGDKTMVADPEKSLDYFASLDEGEESTKEGARLVKVHSKQELDAVLAGNSKVAIKFWAPWCNKCKMLAPHVDELAEKHPSVTVVSFDTTEESLEAVAADMEVKGLPQFRFFKDGKESLEKIMGYKLAPLGEAFKKLEAS